MIASPLPVRAQQSPERMRRIGVLMDFAVDDPEARGRLDVFRAELSRLGWVDGGKHKDRHSVGAGHCQPNARVCRGTGCARAGRHFRIWQSVSWGTAAVDDDNTRRVRDRGRPGWRRLCRQLGPAWRQHHWFHAAGIQHRHEMEVELSPVGMRDAGEIERGLNAFAPQPQDGTRHGPHDPARAPRPRRRGDRMTSPRRLL
jgi:hypothetical protein